MNIIIATLLLLCSTAFAATSVLYKGTGYVSRNSTINVSTENGFTTLVTTSEYTHGVHVQFNGPAILGGHWGIDFVAPNRAWLTAGTTYEGATRYPFQLSSLPGLDFGGGGRGYNKLNGGFTVLEIEYVNGVPVKAAIDFWIIGQAAQPVKEIGSFRMNSNIPHVPEPSVLGLGIIAAGVGMLKRRR